MNNLSALTTTELSEMISNGDITSEELVRATLDSIKINDPKINSFITINEENSIQKAKEIDKEIKNNSAYYVLLPFQVHNLLKNIYVQLSHH